MKIDRRTLLSGGSAAAVTAWLGACSTSVSEIERILMAQFGAETATHEAARAFAREMSAYLAKQPDCHNPWTICDTADARVVLSFLESTTFLSSQANGAELSYVALFDPYNAPCANQLVAPL